MKIINEDELINYIDDIKKNHRVICIETDTIYGLVCASFDEIAVNKIYTIKNRDYNKPIGIFVKDIEDIKEYFDISEQQKIFITNNMKYPTTFIINDNKKLFNQLNHKSSTIGFRIPNNSVIKKMIDYFDMPLAQTSCNISNEEDYKNINEIELKLGNKIDYFIKQNNKVIKTNNSSRIIDISTEPYKRIRDNNIKE